MSPIVGFHVSNPKCRKSIRRHGLLPSAPTAIQPYGVYVYRDDGSFDHAVWSRAFKPALTLWAPWPTAEVWQAAYIGPLANDHLVANGMIFLCSVLPQHVTLVSVVKGN